MIFQKVRNSIIKIKKKGEWNYFFKCLKLIINIIRFRYFIFWIKKQISPLDLLGIKILIRGRKLN